MEKASLKPWCPTMCSRTSGQALLGGRRPQAGKRGLHSHPPPGPLVLLWLPLSRDIPHGFTPAQAPAPDGNSCCAHSAGEKERRCACRTSHSCDLPCGPGSSGTPRCRGCSRRHGRCSGRAGSWGSPRSRAGSGRTAAHTLRGSSGTGPSPHRRRHCKSLGHGTRTLQGEGERGCVTPASPKCRAPTAGQPRAKDLTYVGIHSARTQRSQGRICRTVFQRRWDDIGTALRWGHTPNSRSPGGHTGMLSREKHQRE